jgi:serine/threonine-protein kinase
LARQVELQRDVAVRILNPTADQNDPWRRNLVNDVKTFIRIKHPNLVRMYAAGRVGPFCWLAMEYVPGDNLAHVIDGIKTTGVPDWHVALQIALDIAKALEVAESNEIVHRHLTPKNILIRSTDKVAKLADLMRARTTTNTTGSAAAQSKSVLELAYLSPEQIEDNSKADNRSDIYCLGAAIYGLLTGTPPYEAESVSQLIAKLKSDQPRPPSQVQPTMSDEFEAIVLRVLARNPANRYQSAKLLTADLKKLAAAEKTT